MFADIEELLAARIGFDVETVGRRAVASMVRRAMEEAGFSEPAAYAWVLRHEPEAWDRFVDEVVIPETWFFRDVAPFELAAELVRERLRTDLGRPLRILSCPCSTGEEPYSLVVAMLDAGASPTSFSLDAVDVSRRALEFARLGAFSARSFRGDFPWDREQYFDRAEDGVWCLNASASTLVNFRYGNMIAPDFLKDDAPYDVVLCRNLLIYLRPEARLLAMAALQRLVAEDGVLMLGHAETAFAREFAFRPIGPTGAFAFRKSNVRFTAQGGRTERPTSRAKVSSPSLPVPSFKSAAPLGARIQPVSNVVGQSEKTADSLLALASQLGDAGQLHIAIGVCREYLQQVPDSADGYFLLGVLHDALGHFDLAAGSFRKALYLDPSHREALLHLALKQEARGDSSGAALLRDRARRAQQMDKAGNP